MPPNYSLAIILNSNFIERLWRVSKASNVSSLCPLFWWYESAALNMSANLENSVVATRLEKISFHSNPKERQCQWMPNYYTTALISHASKVTLRILHARLPQYMDRELPDIQARFRKGRGTRDQSANICYHQKSKTVPEKHLLLLHWLCQSLWLCGSQQTVENASRDGNTRPPYLPSEKFVCRSRSNS